jgi:8-oxo-dGTP pyrophosphatase MutT (NUDIX family)/phosphohistidine phosphatase SixA
VTSPSGESPGATVEAAGAVVWREHEGALEVVLVHRPRYQDWSWPKGKLDRGESSPEAAAREVAEETGQPVVLGIPLPDMSYPLVDGSTKHVRYWAARVGGRRDVAPLRARPVVPLATVEEIDDVRWLSTDDAARQLTRVEDREPLEALLTAHRKGRLETRALVIARHSHAKRRSSWGGQEHDRPLTNEGQRQSRALVPVLSAFGVREVVTSQWARCAMTVAPYALAADVEPRSFRFLTEADHERSPGRVAAEVRDTLERHDDVVLCTHRPVLPTVLDVLGEHSRRSVADALPRHDPFLHPGEVLVAHVTTTAKGPRVVAVEFHLPPLF